MTDVLIALVPEYGLWLIFASVVLSCLAVPVPSSVLVLTAGGFASAGDLALWHVILAAFLGYVLGDQIVFHLSRKKGSVVIDHLKARPALTKAMVKSEDLLYRYGHVAIFLSHTVVSPLAPYMSIICGAVGVRWVHYSLGAAIGALVWASAYAMLGYGAMGRLSQSANLLWYVLGSVATLGILGLSCQWLRKAWHHYQDQHDNLNTNKV